MFKALSDIWHEAFCRDVIGFELWTVFVRNVQRCVQSLLGYLSGAFADVPTDLRPEIE